MEQQADKLIQLGEQVTQEAITQYTHWHTVAAACWIVVAVLLTIVSIVCWKTRKKVKDELIDESLMAFWYVIGVASPAIIAILIMAVNIPTLLYPRAYAIHQLIREIVGN